MFHFQKIKLDKKEGNNLEQELLDHQSKQVQAFGQAKMTKYTEQLTELRKYFIAKCSVDFMTFMFGKTGLLTKGTLTRDEEM